jgi:hypothetical protein
MCTSRVVFGTVKMRTVDIGHVIFGAKIVAHGGEVVGQTNQQLDAPRVTSSVFGPKNSFESWIAFCHESVDLTVAPPISRLEDFRVAIEIDDA